MLPTKLDANTKIKRFSICLSTALASLFSIRWWECLDLRFSSLCGSTEIASTWPNSQTPPPRPLRNFPEILWRCRCRRILPIAACSSCSMWSSSSKNRSSTSENRSVRLRNFHKEAFLRWNRCIYGKNLVEEHCVI